MPRISICLLVLFVAAGACHRGNSASASAAPERERVGATATAPVATGGGADAANAGRSAEVREITLPAGTRLPIVLETTVGSDISHVEEPVRARLARPITVQGLPVLPEGSRLSGIVTDVTRPARVKGRAHVAVRFDTLVPAGEDERYRIDTVAVGRTAPGTKKKDALEIGIPAAGGAVIGGLLGGKKGALIGTAAGGGAGTAIVLSTRGQEIHLPRGAALTLRLVRPLTLKVRR